MPLKDHRCHSKTTDVTKGHIRVEEPVREKCG